VNPNQDDTSIPIPSQLSGYDEDNANVPYITAVFTEQRSIFKVGDETTYENLLLVSLLRWRKRRRAFYNEDDASINDANQITNVKLQPGTLYSVTVVAADVDKVYNLLILECICFSPY